MGKVKTKKQTMVLDLCGQMKVYKKDDMELLLFPEFPKWVLVPKGGNAFLTDLIGKKLSDVLQSTQYPEFISEMIDEGIIVPQGEKIELEKPSGSYYPIQAVWLNVTSGCNLACRHCFIQARHRQKNEITPTEIRTLMEQLLEFRGDNSISLDITGGEPLIRDDIEEIVDACLYEGISVRIITNALRITKRLCAFLNERKVSIVISLDGATKETHEYLRGKGTFIHTVEKIRLAVQSGILVSLGMCVHAGNEHEIIDFIKLAKELNANKCNFSFLNKIGNAQENELSLPDLYKTIKRIIDYIIVDKDARKLLIGSSISRFVEAVLLPIRTDCCGTGVNTCAIGANGDVYPCPSHQLPQYCAGNIRTNDFAEIWTKSTVFKPFRALDVNKFNEGCNTCDVRLFCGGGCRAHAHFGNDNGTFYSCNPQCKHMKRLFIDLIWWLCEHEEIANLRTPVGLNLTCS